MTPAEIDGLRLRYAGIAMHAMTAGLGPPDVKGERGAEIVRASFAMADAMIAEATGAAPPKRTRDRPASSEPTLFGESAP